MNFRDYVIRRAARLRASLSANSAAASEQSSQAGQPADASTPRQRQPLRVIDLEPRIMLSATWVEPEEVQNATDGMDGFSNDQLAEDFLASSTPAADGDFNDMFAVFDELEADLNSLEA